METIRQRLDYVKAAGVPEGSRRKAVQLATGRKRPAGGKQNKKRRTADPATEKLEHVDPEQEDGAFTLLCFVPDTLSP